MAYFPQLPTFPSPVADSLTQQFVSAQWYAPIYTSTGTSTLQAYGVSPNIGSKLPSQPAPKVPEELRWLRSRVREITDCALAA